MDSAQKNDFVSLFIEYTKDFESPTNFWLWSAYAAIAASLRYNCCIKWGTEDLYPNIYILLLADSAAYRKDAGPKLVQYLLKEAAHTKVIAGRSSWQGIVDELSQDIGNKKNGMPIKGGGGIIIATEFTAAFVDDPHLIQMMTEGYSYEEEYEYILRGGKTKVKHRCISMLGGSNETLLRELYTIKATYGGLLRRTLLIKPDKRRPPNSLVIDDGRSIGLTQGQKAELLLKLKDIQNLKGMFTLAPEAAVAYDNWYRPLYHDYDKLVDKTGFVQGVHSLIIKLCMILAANERTLVIKEWMVTRAIREILDLKENYMTYAMAAGKNPQANFGAVLLSSLWIASNNPNGQPKNMKRRDILLKYWNEISSEDLDKLLLTLEQAGLVEMIPVGSEPSYALTQVAREAFLKNQKAVSTSTN